jgi:hypothetical protein
MLYISNQNKTYRAHQTPILDFIDYDSDSCFRRFLLNINLFQRSRRTEIQRFNFTLVPTTNPSQLTFRYNNSGIPDPGMHRMLAHDLFEWFYACFAYRHSLLYAWAERLAGKTRLRHTLPYSMPLVGVKLGRKRRDVLLRGFEWDYDKLEMSFAWWELLRDLCPVSV